MRDQEDCHSPKKRKSLIEVPFLTHVKVHFLKLLIEVLYVAQGKVHVLGMFLDRVSLFGKSLRDHINDRSPKKLKSLTGVSYVPQVKVHVLSFCSKFWRSGKVSFIVKAKIVNRGSICGTSESKCSKLQDDPYLIAIACS